MSGLRLSRPQDGGRSVTSLRLAFGGLTLKSYDHAKYETFRLAEQTESRLSGTTDSERSEPDINPAPLYLLQESYRNRNNYILFEFVDTNNHPLPASDGNKLPRQPDKGTAYHFNIITFS